MILFFIFSALLVVVVLALLLPVFFRSAETAEPDRTDINIGIARAQARELSQRLERAEISETDYNDEKKRLEVDLARDIEKEERVSLSVEAKGRGQWLLWPLAAALPVAAGVLYLSLGTLAAFNPESYLVNRAANNSAPVQQQAPDMQEIISRIQLELQSQPDDARAWFMLGRAHLTLGEYAEAETALRKSLELDSTLVDVRVRLADTLALSQDGRLTGEPTEILQTALEMQPNHPQGLWLYGMAQDQNGESAEAIATWQKLLLLVANDPQATAEIEQLINGANARLPESEQVSLTDPTDTMTGSTASSGVAVTVTVDATLTEGLSPETPVFIYAKAASGPPMPLAVVKHALSELPITVQLTDGQAMMESMKISAFEVVVVGARISKTGDPIAQPGDLFSESSALQVEQLTEAVSLTISDIVP